MRLASFGSGLVLAFSAILAAFGCSTSGTAQPLEAGICPLQQSHYYTSPGCKTAAPVPICEVDDPYGDAGCGAPKQVCTCEGVTEPTSCAGHAKSPFSAEGACPADAGADTRETGADAAADTGADAAADTSTDAAASG